MFKKTLIATMLLTALSFSAAGYAAEKGEVSPSRIDGIAEVVSVDIAVPEIVVKHKVPSGGGSVSRYMTLKVAPRTRITKDNGKRTVADLKPGDKAAVEYVTDLTGAVTATSIVLEDGDPQ